MAEDSSADLRSGPSSSPPRSQKGNSQKATKATKNGTEVERGTSNIQHPTRNYEQRTTVILKSLRSLRKFFVKEKVSVPAIVEF